MRIIKLKSLKYIIIYGEFTYKDGKLNGVSKDYHKNGQLRTEAFYKDDIADGIVKIYDEDGKVTN